MKKPFWVLLIAIWCAHLSPALAQTHAAIRDIFQAHQQGTSTYSEVKSLFSSHEPQFILDNCVYYLNSEEETNRQMAVKLIYKIAQQTNDERIKHKATYQLVNKGLRDPSATIIFRTINYLENLPVDCFDAQTKNNLAGTLTSRPPHFKSMVRLSGRLQMDQLIPYYSSILNNDSTLNRSTQWNLHLTLGRLGDQEQVNYCIAQVARIGMNDEVIYRLLPDLLYLNHKLVIDFLLDQLLIENSHCTSADPDHEVAIDCGYRLAEAVAPYVQDFPVRVDASGDLDTDNYVQALVTIREWVTTNRQNYQVQLER
ncbi:MAG: hypothetical protein JEZ14_14090 [Marinilabiliaceae bacterium]|nr:hypothetical protein [Marinilabiliaceae bacterium]